MEVFQNLRESFLSTFGAPADNNPKINRLINELIQIRIGSGRDFRVYDGNSTNGACDYFIEFPRGNDAPSTICLAQLFIS